MNDQNNSVPSQLLSNESDPASHSTNWINSAGGRKVDLRNPDPDAIDIIDIAHALSMICRFNGHVDKFYSVAEHCVVTSHLVPQEGLLPLWALLHDAAEAYLGDVTSPLKALLPDYQSIEENFENILMKKFGIVGPKPAEVVSADRAALVLEAGELISEVHEEWRLPEEWADPLMVYQNVYIAALPPPMAYEQFLIRYRECVKIWEHASMMHAFRTGDMFAQRP